ncbi:MAG: hypothetical protein Q8R55_00255 [Candidatus Taylorbacteria bacterium]|nr:hypothetical protein [Candidatus Taylorbacteria bacterium]
MNEQGESFGQYEARELESREAVMERGALARLGILADYLREGFAGAYKDPTIQKFLNMSPVIGDGIMGVKALAGKEGDRQLSVRERAFYSIAAVTGGAAWFAAAKGKYREAFVLNGVSEMFTQVDAWPAIIEDQAAKLKNQDSNLSRTLSAVGGWMEKRKQDLEDLGLLGSQLNTLNLRELPDER